MSRVNRLEKLFPKEVQSVGDLPALVGEIVRQHQPEAPRRLVMVPSDTYPVRRKIGLWDLPFGWRKTPFRTLALGTNELVVIEIGEQQQESTLVIPLAKLVEIHLFQVLLYSFVELSWMAGDNLQTIRIEYNSVGDRVMRRCVDQIRAVFPPCLPTGSYPPPETDLSFLPFKFVSYLRSSLLPGETLRTAVYQPAIRTALLKPTPNRAVALTDRELIVVEDRLRLSTSPDSYYTMIRHLYPLAQIESLAVERGTQFDDLRLRAGSGRSPLETILALTHANAETLHQTFYARPASETVH